MPPVSSIGEELVNLWEQAVLEAIAHESKAFKNERYTEIYLPLRIVDKWMMVVCDPGLKRTWLVAFDLWEW